MVQHATSSLCKHHWRSQRASHMTAVTKSYEERVIAREAEFVFRSIVQSLDGQK